MVYYHTSGNIKMIRLLVQDYCSTLETQTSPFEYMKTYVEKCPIDTESGKILWITETFLNIQKHRNFLKSIAAHLSEQLTEEEQDYFIIILFSVIFQIEPKDMESLYKCIFNLSKSLLNIFAEFLSNNETLTFVAQVARSYYDTDYITEKIVNPLFLWLPYISEMGHTYEEYVKKIQKKKMKPPTVPVQLNVLNRKQKETPYTPPVNISIPSTPPNSLLFKSGKKMLTKSVIDKKLKLLHDKNKLKADAKLNEVKSKDFHYAQVKSEKYYKKLELIKEETRNEVSMPIFKRKTSNISNPPLVKDTATTLKRMNKTLQQAEESEIQWLEDLLKNCKIVTQVDQALEYERQELERKRLLDIEKNHLIGQISHEEAIIAKKKLMDKNKKKYEMFLKEKEIWNEEIEKWKLKELEKNRKHVEKLSMIELNMLQARNDVFNKKKEASDKLKKERNALLENAMQIKQKELQKKSNMIKELKMLAIIAKKAKLPKIIDFTETSGIGLLCEMSLAELQERIGAMKIELNDELERKKVLIMKGKEATKNCLEETKANIKTYMAERSDKKKVKNARVTLSSSECQELSNLKDILAEKRKLRIQLTA